MGGGKSYLLKLHRDVAAFIEKHFEDPRFRPALLDLLAIIAANPKQFQLKQGQLYAHRAAKIRFGAVEWRCVFYINEIEHVVYVQALAAHDDAYKQAERRR